jgi:AraC-like DNA-binding protein
MDEADVLTPAELSVSIDITHIITLHYMKYTKDFTFTGEKHNFWEMVYIDKGEVGVLAGVRELNLREGEVIFHKPNEYHSIWAKGRYANVAVVTFVSKSPAMSFFESKTLLFGEAEREMLANIISTGKACFKGELDDGCQTNLEQEDNHPFASVQLIKNYLELLLITLIQKHSEPSGVKNPPEDEKRQDEKTVAESIRQILADNVYGEITMDYILKRLCFSKSYLTQMFRKYTGNSIMGYYTDLKIEEAKKLISERELSFGEIAGKLNFNSIHYFSNMFKKKTNMTPSEYRRSIQSRSLL